MSDQNITGAFEFAEPTRDERIVTSTETVTQPFDYTTEPVTAQVTELVINEGVPTQVANPSRASWRSFVQSLVGFLLVLNTAAALALPFVLDPANGLADALGPVYGYVVIGLNVITFVGSTLTKLVALLMANPTVNDWIGAHLPWLAPIRPAAK